MASRRDSARRQLPCCPTRESPRRGRLASPRWMRTLPSLRVAQVAVDGEGLPVAVRPPLAGRRGGGGRSRCCPRRRPDRGGPWPGAGPGPAGCGQGALVVAQLGESPAAGVERSGLPEQVAGPGEQRHLLLAVVQRLARTALLGEQQPAEAVVGARLPDRRRRGPRTARSARCRWARGVLVVAELRAAPGRGRGGPLAGPVVEAQQGVRAPGAAWRRAPASARASPARSVRRPRQLPAVPVEARVGRPRRRPRAAPGARRRTRPAPARGRRWSRTVPPAAGAAVRRASRVGSSSMAAACAVCR